MFVTQRPVSVNRQRNIQCIKEISKLKGCTCSYFQCIHVQSMCHYTDSSHETHKIHVHYNNIAYGLLNKVLRD